MVVVRRTKALALGSGWVGLMASCSPSCPDRGPVEVDAGAGQIVCAGQTVTLHGTAMAEPGAEMLVFEWEQTAGPEASLDNPSSADPSFVATAAGVYDFRLTITTSDDCATGDDAVRLVVLEPNDCGACATGGCCLDEHCDDGDSCTVDSCVDGECRSDAVREDCGDGSCGDCTETCGNCPDDCGLCAGCGNSECAGDENPCNCPADCGAEPECCTHADCDDGLFCNGAESCQEDTCVSSGPPCSSTADLELCDEESDTCSDPPCAGDADCDDGVFCNGGETCAEDGFCAAGQSPCPDSCDEVNDTCSSAPPPSCASDVDCGDGDACTTNLCVNGSCQSGAVQCPTSQTCDPGSGNCTSGGATIRAYDACFATSMNTAVTINLRANADPHVETLEFEIVGQPTNGALSGTPPEVTYTPSAGFAGNDMFTFQASDGETSSAAAGVTMFVGADDPECTGYYQCISGAASPIDEYTFGGAVGERVTVYLDHVGSMSLRLTPPAGAGASDWFEDLSSMDRQIDNVTLPASGEYTITVEGFSVVEAVEYFLCLLRQDQPVIPIGYGQCEQRGIEAQGDQDSFTFFGVQGEQLTLYLIHDSYMSLRLTPPSGASGGWYEDFSTAERLIDEVTLPATGEYIITVDGFLDYTGDYQLCLDRLQ